MTETELISQMSNDNGNNIEIDKSSDVFETALRKNYRCIGIRCGGVKLKKRNTLPRTAISDGMKWFDYYQCPNCKTNYGYDKSEHTSEADEISDSDLFAAADMFDDLMNGTFYEKQEASGYRIKYIN